MAALFSLGRRCLLTGAAAGAALAPLEAFSQAETLAFVGEAAAQGAIGYAAKSALEGIVGNNSYKQITDRLDVLTAKVDALLNILVRIDAIVSKAVAEQFQRDREAHLNAYLHIAVSVLSGVRAQPDAVQRDRLSKMLEGLQISTETIWTYGNFVYPLAASGLFTTFAVFKAMKSPKTEVKTWAEIQRSFFIRALITSDPKSLTNIRDTAEGLRVAHQREIDVMPRDRRNVGGGEAMLILPQSGLPPYGAQFTAEFTNPIGSEMWNLPLFPGIQRGVDKWGNDILNNRFNAQLKLVRDNEQLRDFAANGITDILVICAGIDTFVENY